MADKKKLPAPSIKKVWVSKYGLSKGVYELEVDSAHSNGYVIQGFFYGRMGRDVHQTREEAEERVRVMAKRKLVSLKEQMKKLLKIVNKGEAK